MLINTYIFNFKSYFKRWTKMFKRQNDCKTSSINRQNGL